MKVAKDSEYVAVYKCRWCGELIFKNDETLTKPYVDEFLYYFENHRSDSELLHFSKINSRIVHQCNSRGSNICHIGLADLIGFQQIDSNIENR